MCSQPTCHPTHLHQALTIVTHKVKVLFSVAIASHERRPGCGDNSAKSWHTVTKT